VAHLSQHRLLPLLLERARQGHAAAGGGVLFGHAVQAGALSMHSRTHASRPLLCRPAPHGRLHGFVGAVEVHACRVHLLSRHGSNNHPCPSAPPFALVCSPVRCRAVAHHAPPAVTARQQHPPPPQNCCPPGT
jgi:hypothetical protein